MINSPDYDGLEQQARLRNVEKLRRDLSNEGLQEKIRNWAKRWGLEYEYVYYNLLTNDIFAMNFAKDPSRQSIHQNIANEHIKKNIPLVENFIGLPSGGDSAKFIFHGTIQQGRPTASDHNKSIDFEWSFTSGNKKLHVYATHKHTKEAGGSQDHQFNDIKHFLKDARESTDKDACFIAICDGPYYMQAYEGYSSRIAYLAGEFTGTRIRACNISSLPKAYGDLLRHWLSVHNLTLSVEQQDSLNMLV